MENDTVNQIKSVYPLDDFKNCVNRAAKNGMFVITDKKKAQAILSEVGVQPSERSRLLELLNDSISQTGDDVKHFSDIGGEETKNSLRHSLGISDNTAEVASYYGFAAVFAALVASEAADVVDSALAAVVEFVAAALDVAVDSSAAEVPAVEDNSAKADEVSLELSAGNVVESVDELFCVPFNLKAFKKPFTPRPK